MPGVRRRAARVRRRRGARCARAPARRLRCAPGRTGGVQRRHGTGAAAAARGDPSCRTRVHRRAINACRTTPCDMSWDRIVRRRRGDPGAVPRERSRRHAHAPSLRDGCTSANVTATLHSRWRDAIRRHDDGTKVQTITAARSSSTFPWIHLDRRGVERGHRARPRTTLFGLRANDTADGHRRARRGAAHAAPRSAHRWSALSRLALAAARRWSRSSMIVVPLALDATPFTCSPGSMEPDDAAGHARRHAARRPGRHRHRRRRDLPAALERARGGDAPRRRSRVRRRRASGMFVTRGDANDVDDDPVRACRCAAWSRTPCRTSGT